MGKLICTESCDEGGFGLMGLLLALVIALVLMVVCQPRPRRPRLICVPRCYC